MKRRVHLIATAAGLAALIAFSPPAAARTASSETSMASARGTLRDMKELARSASSEANQLMMFSQNLQASSDSHYLSLMALKSDLNTMGQQLASLDARRDSLQPWEQSALDKVYPLLKEAAGNTERAIEYYNENRNYLWNPEYRDHAESVERDSRQIANTLKDFLRYDKLREEERQLKSSIQVGAD